MSPIALVARGLSHGFTDGPLLFADVDFDISGGDMVAVVGPSGSGKSTLLALLAGWLTPSRGSLERREIARIRWVFQNPHGQSRRTALDHVVYPWLAAGASRDEAEVLGHALLRDFGLAEVAGRAFRHLSGGEAQRLMLARAVASSPDLLLVDEPTAQLDRATATTVNSVLGGLTRPKTIVVIATHDHETRDACSRVIDLAEYRAAD